MLFVKLLSLGLLVSSVLLSTAEAEDSAAPPAPVQIKFSADAWSRYSFMCYESLNPKCGDQAISPYYMHIHSSLSLFDQKKDEAIAKQSFNNSDWSQFQFTLKEQLQRYQDAKGCKDNLDTLANLNKGPSGQCALQGQKPVAAITSEVKTQPKLQAGDSCPAVQIPNGGGFGGQFLKGLAADPDDPTVLYGMTQNFDGPSAKNMAFLSKSTDGGKTWVLIQRIEDQANSATPIFSGGIDVKIPLVVGKGSPKSFVFGSKVGLFQIVPPSSSVQALRKPAATSAKETVGANDIKLSEDGERMVVSINHQNPGSGEVV